MESGDLERWRRVQELFEAAADLRPGEQAAYLAAACGDDGGLRQEVEALLRSDAEAGSFIENAIRRGSEVLLPAEPDPLETLGKIGKYEILGRIGEGGFGVVYKGRDAVLQRYVAVKTCSSRDEKLRRRFFREGQIAAGLQHPNITTVYDLGVERGIPYLVQEFLDGEDLNHKIARQEGFTTLRRLDILAQVAQGLEYAHLQGVLHRDVKPANIRILPAGTVKIMDFGIAKLLHEVSDVTTQGVTMGTVGYLAPEQLRGEEVDRRTDIFSFGVLLYELSTYRRPFPGSTFSEVSYRLLNEEPAALDDLAPVHGQAIAELARRCLAKDPANRFQSFAEVLAVLEPEIAALRSGPLPVRAGAGGQEAGAAGPGGATAVVAASGPAERGQGPARRRRAAARSWRWAAAVALAASLGAAGTAALWRQEQGPRPGGADRRGGAGVAPGGGGGAEEGSSSDAAAGRGGPAGAGGGRAGAAGQTVAGGFSGAGAGQRAAAPAAETGAPGAGAPGTAAGDANRARTSGGPSPPASPSSAPARMQDRQATASPGSSSPGSPDPPGSRRTVPPSVRSASSPASRLPAPVPFRAGAGGPAGGAETASRGGGARPEPGQDGGVRGEHAPAAAGAMAPVASGAEAGAAGSAYGAAGVEEEWRGLPGASSGGAGPDAGESAGGAAAPIRPMVRGDLIPPGAPHSTPPRLLSRPDPHYPDRARRRQVESDVLMLVLVDEGGHVVRTIIKRTDDPGLGFNEAARQAALRATFHPASRDGLPGKMWTELPFSFRLHAGT